MTIYKLIENLIILENKLNNNLIEKQDINLTLDAIINTLDFNDFCRCEIKDNKIYTTIVNYDNNINVEKIIYFLLSITNLAYCVSHLTIYNKRNKPYTLDIDIFKNNYLSDYELEKINKFDLIIE